MAKPDYCYLYLTCESSAEANEVTDTLLEKRLIVCAKQLSVDSKFQWNGEIEQSKEVLLIMESRLDLFKQTEKEVAKIHSYNTFVLEAVPIAEVSEKAKQWMAKELS